MHRRSHNLLNCDMNSIVHSIILRQISSLCAVVGNHRGWPQKLSELPLVLPGSFTWDKRFSVIEFTFGRVSASFTESSFCPILPRMNQPMVATKMEIIERMAWSKKIPLIAVIENC